MVTFLLTLLFFLNFNFPSKRNYGHYGASSIGNFQVTNVEFHKTLEKSCNTSLLANLLLNLISLEPIPITLAFFQTSRQCTTMEKRFQVIISIKLKITGHISAL